MDLKKRKKLSVNCTAQKINAEEDNKLIKQDNLFFIIYSLIEAGIEFVYRLRYFLWKKAALERTIL